MLEILKLLKGSLKMTIILVSPPQITRSAMSTVVVNLKIDVSMFAVANNTTWYYPPEGPWRWKSCISSSSPVIFTWKNGRYMTSKRKKQKKLPWPCFKLGYALESFMTVKLDGFKSLNGFGMVSCEALERQVARVSAFLHIQKLSVHIDRPVWSQLATLADSDNHIILHLFLHQSSINGLDVISEAEEEKKRITQQGMVLAGHSWSFGRGFLDKTIWSQWQFREFCGWWK